MKKRTLIVIGIFAAVFCTQGCKKYKQYTDFDLNYTQNVTIPASGGLLNAPIDIVSPNMTTETDSKYDNNGTAAKLVDNVTLTKLSLTVNSPSQANFDFLNSVEIYLSSPSQHEVLVAYIYDVPETGLRSLNLTCRDENLKAALQDDSYKVRVRTVMDHPIPYDVGVTSYETFHVKAKLKNLFKK